MKKIKFIIALFSILLLLLSGCNGANGKLSQKMIDKYSDNNNYISFMGEVIECNGNDVLIKCDSLKTYISYEDDVCQFYIQSSKALNLEEGSTIVFVTVPFHFYNGHKLPIVELKTNEKVLLPFEEGKENLIEWVNTNIK